MQITFCPPDRQFAAKLLEDLKSRGLTVVLDEQPDHLTALTAGGDPRILVISRFALNWPAATVETALPVVIDDVALPEPMGIFTKSWRN